MTEQIFMRALDARDLFGLPVPLQRYRPVDGTDGRVGGIDPAIDYSHGHPGTRGLAPRPVLVDGKIDPRHRAQRLGAEGVSSRPASARP